MLSDALLTDALEQLEGPHEVALPLLAKSVREHIDAQRAELAACEKMAVEGVQSEDATSPACRHVKTLYFMWRWLLHGIERQREEFAAELARSEREHEQTIAARDLREEQVERIAVALGCDKEWSNLHDHGDCALEAASAQAAELARVREERDRWRDEFTRLVEVRDAAQAEAAEANAHADRMDKLSGVARKLMQIADASCMAARAEVGRLREALEASRGALYRVCVVAGAPYSKNPDVPAECANECGHFWCIGRRGLKASFVAERALSPAPDATPPTPSPAFTWHTVNGDEFVCPGKAVPMTAEEYAAVVARAPPNATPPTDPAPGEAAGPATNDNQPKPGDQR